MITYEITYINAISKKDDYVIINCGDEFEFETGKETVTCVADIPIIFEMIASKWWGTYESMAAIKNIKVKEI